MFENCGNSIKTIAKLLFSICLVAAGVILIAELGDGNSYLLGSLAAFFIAEISLIITSIIGSTVLYGFGEIVECIKEIRDQGDA